MPPGKKPLEPLIPLDELKKIVADLAALPKEKAEEPKPKARRRSKARTRQ